MEGPLTIGVRLYIIRYPNISYGIADFCAYSHSRCFILKAAALSLSYSSVIFILIRGRGWIQTIDHSCFASWLSA